MRRPDIFVCIASYRDPETQWTIADLFRKATYPDRVRVGVCWQYLPEDSWYIQAPVRPAQVSALHFDATESQGACWARSLAHGLRGHEEYTLQLDSHIRLHHGWDERLIDMLASCPSSRPVLSSYPAPYTPPDDLQCGVFMLAPRNWEHHGVVSLEGKPIVSPLPVRCPWIAGGFIFSRSNLWDEVPYDPSLYFIGEEATLSVRAFSRGWDAYAPNECIVHHYYGRQQQPKHWTDHRRWSDKNLFSVRRAKHLLGAVVERDVRIISGLDGPLGLGDARTLREFEAFARIDFRRSCRSVETGAV